MQIQTQCQCGAKFAFSKEQVGQAFRCSVCHQVFHVPAPGEKPVMAPAAEFETHPAHQPPKYPAPSRRSSGSGLGCLACAFILFVLLALGGVFMVLFIAADSATTISKTLSTVDGVVEMTEGLEHLADPQKTISKYTDQGYEHVSNLDSGQPERFKSDTLVTIQILELTSDAQANLALLSQVATLRGDVTGSVDFYGQVLTIEKDAVIHGDLNLGFAQMVVIRGKVQGKLTGGYQTLVGEENVEGGLDPNGGVIDLMDVDLGEDFGGHADVPTLESIEEIPPAKGDTSK